MILRLSGIGSEFDPIRRRPAKQTPSNAWIIERASGRPRSDCEPHVTDTELHARSGRCDRCARLQAADRRKLAAIRGTAERADSPVGM